MKLNRLISPALLIMALILLVTSCAYVRPEDNRVVMTLSGEKIYYDYFRYVYLNSKADQDLGEEGYWEAHPEEEAVLKETVMEILLKNRAIQLMAEEYGIELTKEQSEEVEKTIANLREQHGSDKAFRESLASAHMTEYTLYYIQSFTQIWNDVYDYVMNDVNGIIRASDSDIEADVAVNFRRIRYVYLEKSKTNPEKTAALAESIYQEAIGGADFDELIREHGEDQTMDGVLEYGYYFTKGQIDPQVEALTDTLKDNEIAPVMDASHGYFIIQRLPIESPYLEKHFEDIRVMYKARIFNEMVSAMAETIEIDYKALYHELNIATVN